MAVSAALRRRAARVRLVVMDVDGVLTDGGMYYSERGDELKKFNTRDGHGIALLHAAGITTALVTREQTAIVTRRAAKLGITEVHQGALDKLPVVKGVLEKYGVAPSEACYISDDVSDLEVMGCVGFAVAVADALPQVRRIAHYVTRHRGGDGAVREVCDLILSAPGRPGRSRR